MTGAVTGTVRREFNRMRARSFAGDGYEGVKVAGLAVVAADTGRVLLAQRSYDETDDEDIRETYEFPGGHLNPDEEPFEAAMREFDEEVGLDLPLGDVVNGWRASEGEYQGFVYVIDTEIDVDGWSPTDEVQAVQWVMPGETGDLAIRPEMADFDWSLVDVSRNEEPKMSEMPPEVEPDETDDETGEDLAEPDLSLLDLAGAPIPIHGVLAPEDTESGDARGFTAGAVSARNYRLPFMWQESQTSGHDGAVTVGSVDRLMRKDGLIHWEGSLMPAAKAGEFAELLAFFGRFGVSVDGVNGNMDAERTNATKVLWYDAVRAAGLTAVSIPAFSEAYVAFGPHPDMPETDSPEFEVLRASGAVAEFATTVSFDRGPGWVTNPKETRRLHAYWTKKGQPGYAKIRWGTPGDFTRAKKLIGEKIGANSPEDLRYLNQIIAQWHHDALGYWPGELGKPGNPPATKENRRRAARHASSAESVAFTLDTMVASGVARPPASYFERHPETGALVITEPDEAGIRRTYGYAGEWGVCHIGFGDRCVEIPADVSGGYTDFHLGRTKTCDAGYLPTGLITYKVAHRDAERILSESAEQAHYDDVTNAWAAVRLGEDERGVWFSGVVLPHVSEDDLTLIEASGQVSGEWKYGALRTLLTVGTPGFPVERTSAEFSAEGEVIALAASAFNTVECEPTPAEKMAGLAQVCAEADAKVEATARFAQLKEAWS